MTPDHDGDGSVVGNVTVRNGVGVRNRLTGSGRGRIDTAIDRNYIY
jgi:hypothetical protein